MVRTLNRRRLGVLISGRGSNMAALLAACEAPDFPAQAALVIADRPHAGGLAIARDAGAATRVVDHAAFAGRDAFDAALDAALVAAEVDLVCLAGFMRILGGDFVRRWRGRLLNIHPSLLPRHKGLNTHARAIVAGDAEAGCTVHFVIARLDAGPTIAQARAPIHPGDSADALAARVLREEHRIYPEALRLVALGQARLRDDDTVDFAAD